MARLRASEGILEARLQQVVFRVDGAAFDWADAALGWACRGRWRRVEAGLFEGLACEHRPEADILAKELEEAAKEFRYARGLISADETHDWLEERGLDREAWFRFLRRSESRRRFPGAADEPRTELPASAAELERELWVEAICTGALADACRDLANRAAISASGAGVDVTNRLGDAIEGFRKEFGDANLWSELFDSAERVERVARLEVAFEAAREIPPTQRSLETCVATHHLDWIRFDAEMMSFEREGMAREACLRVREDGDDFASIALDAKIAVDRTHVFLEDLPVQLHAPFTAAKDGDVVGPLELDHAFHIYQIHAKTLPELGSSEVAFRARERHWQNRIRNAVDEHVRWEFKP